MNAQIIKHLLAGGLLALSFAAQSATGAYAVQDQDNTLACCLASEWTLSGPATADQTQRARLPRADASKDSPSRKAKCQTELGDLSCCVGAEWVLQPAEEPLPATTTATPEREAAEDFCCLASEYFVR